MEAGAMAFLAYEARGHLECLRRRAGKRPKGTGKPLALVCEQYEKTAANAFFPVSS